MIIYILGRQPAISLAELESLYGADKIRPIGAWAAAVDSEEPVDFASIGGALKVARVFTTYRTTDWADIQKLLKKTINEHMQYIPEGKFKLGISTYGFKISPAKITASGLSLKKVIQASGHSVRLVPNVDTSLNSAQVLHNKLTGELGWELLLIRDKNQTILAQTTAVQDIDAYTLRDRGRPQRDTRIGMLPPKLAQTIINLAGGAGTGSRLLDPFCGTGVILQEAALMGLQVYGTDLEERMIRYSRDNLNWLTDIHNIHFDWYLHKGDAIETSWQQPIDIVASETYLGRPFTSVPSGEILQKTINDCDTIIKKFLTNIAPQVKSGTRFCLAVPAWFVGERVFHLKTLDHLEDLGYNRISFVHSTSHDLVYRREGQTVGRELLVLTRK